MSKFEEGEKVKFVGDPEDYCRESGWDGIPEPGDVVTIGEIDRKCTLPDEPSIRINGWWFAQIELQKIEQNDMSEFKPFYVNVDGPNHSKLLQQIAFEEEFRWENRGQEVLNTDKSYLDFGLFNKYWRIGYSEQGSVYDNMNTDKLVDPTIKEFKQALRGEYFEPEPDPIRIAGYEVEFYPEHIKIGCEEFSHSQVIRIFKQHRGFMGQVNETSLYVSLSHPDVGDIPFEKVEAIYNRITD